MPDFGSSASRSPRRTRGLLVDLAFAEFTDQDLTDDALWIPNALVLSTLSKAYGLAGLRVGDCAGSPEVIRWRRTAGAPFSLAGELRARAAPQVGVGRGRARRTRHLGAFVPASCGARASAANHLPAGAEHDAARVLEEFDQLEALMR